MQHCMMKLQVCLSLIIVPIFLGGGGGGVILISGDHTMQNICRYDLNKTIDNVWSQIKGNCYELHWL